MPRQLRSDATTAQAGQQPDRPLSDPDASLRLRLVRDLDYSLISTIFPAMDPADADGVLRRSLSLGHVFSLSTGAMISSGLFLLPGLASTKGGPSMILAYFIAGLLAIPAMLSVAELSTAMPRSGGAYYFLERALGPAVGTVAGAGTWLSLVLKDAFALVGMSAYLNLIVDVPANRSLSDSSFSSHCSTFLAQKPPLECRSFSSVL